MDDMIIYIFNLLKGGKRILPLAEARLVGTMERAFSVVASQLWNSLHRVVYLTLTLKPFLKGVKMDLYSCV